jgi:hypothetical protein
LIPAAASAESVQSAPATPSAGDAASPGVQKQRRENTRRFEDLVSLTYGVAIYRGTFYTLQYGVLSATNHFWFRPGIEVTAGARLGFGSELKGDAAAEGFAGVYVSPHFPTLVDEADRIASWRPAVGVEAGLSTARVRPQLAAGPLFVYTGGEGEQPGTAYVMIAAAPLRFRFSALTLSVLGLATGTALAAPGRVMRVQLNVLELGLSW